MTPPTDPRPGLTWGLVLLWMILTVILNAAWWAAGFRDRAMAEALTAGEVNIEDRGIGEVGPDVVREAITTQRDTRAFWTAVAALGDFLFTPALLGFRVLIVAIAFSGLAALTGRPTRFAESLYDNAKAQGYWVLGLGVQVALAIVLRRSEVATSAALFLPPGSVPASLYVALDQLNAFWILGYLAMTAAARRRGQVGLVGAVLVGTILFGFEAAVRTALTLLVGAGMRLTLIPE